MRESDVEYAVLDPESQLAYALREQEGWQVVHNDPDIQLLEPPPGWFSQP